MFGKRRRAASNPPIRAPPSASASLAATKAFRESNPALSNAAAAAALRSHATTPTPVGDTITKRMVRRNSVSSSGSGGHRPGGLQRQSSSGSMTERTFRSPSPGRGSPADSNAPPVPAVPKNLAQTGAVHRRASSLEPTFRGGSPSPRGGGRGVSLDRGTGKNTAARGQRATSNLAQVLEDDMDPNQRSSVNFSRPMSPASAARQSTSKGWYGGPVINQDAVRDMAATSRPRTSGSVASYDYQNAADRPRTHQVARSVEGLHFSTGGMRAKPSGTAVQSRSFLPSQGPVDPKSPDAVFDPSTRTFIRKQDAMSRHRELHEEPEQPTHQYVTQRVKEYHPQHAAPQHRTFRTPSPELVRTPPRRVEPEPVRRQQEVALPRLETTSRIRHPEDPPTGLPKQDTHANTAFERQQHQNAVEVDPQHAEQANTSRKLESTSVQPVPIDVFVSPNVALNQDSSYPRLPPSTVPSIANTLAAQGQGNARVSHDRGQSLSPPRYAHFAPMAVELAGAKHQPPPRSISPAKSALKASPSASRRGSSPVAPNGRLLSRGTASETSDTTSEGGSKTKKRGVRVSFEDAPVVAGTSAYTDASTPTSPVGLESSKWSSTQPDKSNEFEDFMKPRPALPTFGSVREREGRSAQDGGPEKVTETVSATPMSASAATLVEPLPASSDHAVGGILAQNFAHKQPATNDPLPPEVTTVEGSGYVSDSSDEVGPDAGTHKHGAMDDSSQVLPVPEPKSLTTPYDEPQVAPAPISKHAAGVPEIALLPATPSPMDHPEPKYQSMVVPGGWSEEVHNAEAKSVAPTVKPAAPAAQPVSFQPVPFQPIEPPTTIQGMIARDEDSSDDNSSVYSDAYEDLSDTEGGFGSINAIVKSPAVSSTPGLMSSKHADAGIPESSSSGLRNEVAEEDHPEPVTTPLGGWDAAKEHWSGVNQSLKQSPVDKPSIGVSSHLESTTARVLQAPIKQAEPSTEHRIEPRTAAAPRTNAPTQAQDLQPSSKPLRSALKKAPVTQPRAAEPQIRKTMRGPQPRDERAVEPHIRKTMRGPPPRETRTGEPQMRSTMRAGVNPSPRGEPQMRSSMRAAEPNVTGNMGLAASRYSMPPVETKAPRGALQKKNIPMPTTPAKSRPQSVPSSIARPGVPVPAPTYDSDSDGSASSFQRTRARRRNQGASTMRSSMRQGPAPTMRASAPAPAPIRAISPPASPKPAIRKSMRPSSPTPEPPKSSKFSIRSLSPMGRFRSNKAIEAAPPVPVQPKVAKQPKVKAPVAERAKPAFTSRFADSSDEEDDRAPRFQSRFDDSDDDEPGDYKLPPGLAPVRGIPRRQGDEDGDSTDLEEEADDTPLPGAPAVSNNQTNGNANGQGAVLAAGSLRDSKHAPSTDLKAKRAFFGMGKKKTSTPPIVTSTPSTPTKPSEPVPASPTEIPLPPQQRNREPGLPLTPIDEDKDFGSPVATSPQSRKAPKLQRRSTPEWPLPPVPAIPLDERPMSSDGITPRRPRFAMRQSSAMSSATAPIGETPGRTVSYGRSGKKKKFQGLRRVFGLND